VANRPSKVDENVMLLLLVVQHIKPSQLLGQLAVGDPTLQLFHPVLELLT